MSKLHTLIDYLRYRIISKNAHGIHSPFVFHVYNEVIVETADFYEYKKLNTIRRTLESDTTELSIEDFGAGSKVFKGNKRKISEICRHGISAEKQARLLFRLVNYFAPRTSVELGTSIGLTSMYLALAAKNSLLYTIEGSAELAAFAQKQFDTYGVENIRLLKGTFDEQLPALLQQTDKVDFAYVDGNHSKEPTLRYFHMLLKKCHNDSVLVFDDINWSQEMKAAWQEIKQHPDVRLTIDLYFTGIIFFRKEHKMKEHFVLRF
ncbi:MAG: class SAM-dependent methyltransferase [Bacteroidetes bacterium]|nr:class SAM-dependent methyltransferase [Bacteroidota bacterium]